MRPWLSPPGGFEPTSISGFARVEPALCVLCVSFFRYMFSADSLLMVAVPLGIWATVLCFVLAIMLAVSDGIQRLRRLHQIPCFRCKFYTHSPYLKCPVRPCEAGSEAALCCTDYAAVEHRPRPSPTKTQLKRLVAGLTSPRPI